jgi:hypothetical protein
MTHIRRNFRDRLRDAGTRRRGVNRFDILRTDGKAPLAAVGNALSNDPGRANRRRHTRPDTLRQDRWATSFHRDTKRRVVEYVSSVDLPTRPGPK